MNEEIFWEIIELLDWNEEGIDDSVLKPAVLKLASVSTDDIYMFDDILAEMLFLLDGLSFASNIGEGSFRPGAYFSSDYFLYVRCYVVANGRAFFNQVLSDPHKMPKDAAFEALLYLPAMAYKKKTGSGNYDHTTMFNPETFSNTVRWEKPVWPR